MTPFSANLLEYAGRSQSVLNVETFGKIVTTQYYPKTPLPLHSGRPKFSRAVRLPVLRPQFQGVQIESLSNPTERVNLVYTAPSASCSVLNKAITVPSTHRSI